MKKFILWFCGVFCAIICATIATTALISCDQTGPKILQKPAVGVKEVSVCLDSIVNPRLNTTKDVFELQNKLVTNAYIDSVFVSMDQKTLENVASVCLKRLHIVTKDDIVSEFIKNRAIYDNLPPNSSVTTIESTTPPSTTTEKPIAKIELVEEGKTTVTEAPQTRVEEQPAGYKDTTINGKHALISVQ